MTESKTAPDVRAQNPHPPPIFKRRFVDVPLDQFRVWKWALLKRGLTWDEFLLRGGDALVRDVVKAEIARGRKVPQGIAEFIGHAP